MLMMTSERTRVISIVHTHVTQYISYTDLINLKIALPKDYDFYLEDTVFAKILTGMLYRKGISVSPCCLGLIDIPKSQTVELVQSFHKIIQQIICCYDYDDTFPSFLSHQFPVFFYAKRSEHKQIFNYVETLLPRDDIHFVSRSFADMIGKIEQFEQDNDELVFIYFSSDCKAFIALPANISCKWCTNCDEGHYNTVISMSGDKDNFFCNTCGISFCFCNEDYTTCSRCGCSWCYACEEDENATGEMCIQCGRFTCCCGEFCTTCWLGYFVSDDEGDDDDDDE